MVLPYHPKPKTEVMTRELTAYSAEKYRKGYMMAVGLERRKGILGFFLRLLNKPSGWVLPFSKEVVKPGAIYDFKYEVSTLTVGKGLKIYTIHHEDGFCVSRDFDKYKKKWTILMPEDTMVYGTASKNNWFIRRFQVLNEWK